MGADGLLRHDSTGELQRTTLADKVLTLAEAKLVNLVPDAGIWMNTQRPEWNDANNALAGPGVSVVTAAYLIGYNSWTAWRTRRATAGSTCLELLTTRDTVARDTLACRATSSRVTAFAAIAMSLTPRTWGPSLAESRRSGYRRAVARPGR